MKNFFLITFLLSLCVMTSCKKEINEPTFYGCTDPSSLNYDPLANTDDGSCTYKDTTTFKVRAYVKQSPNESHDGNVRIRVYNYVNSLQNTLVDVTSTTINPISSTSCGAIGVNFNHRLVLGDEYRFEIFEAGAGGQKLYSGIINTFVNSFGNYEVDFVGATETTPAEVDVSCYYSVVTQCPNGEPEGFIFRVWV